MKHTGRPYVDIDRLRALLKNPLHKKSWGIAQSEQKPAKNNDRVANRTLTFKRTPK
jgi:hypothetical protein